MKTITFIVNLAAYGGVETVFRDYYFLLAGQYHINLATTSFLPDNVQEFCRQNNIPYICRMKKPEHRFSLQYLKYKINKIGLKKQIRRLCQRSDFVIDFKNGHGNDILKQFSASTSQRILWIHGGMPFVKECMTDIDFSIYDKIVCLTDSLKKDMEQQYPALKNKIVRIYNPMDIENIKTKALEPTPNIPQGKYFLHVSRIDTDKDFQTLIDGYDLFYRQTSSATPLYIVGDGSTKTQWETYAAGLSSAAQIRFIGKKENPFPYMKNAAATILSSPSEGLPCVLIEALACTNGIVVSSDCPNGPQEILGNGKFGMLFDVGDTVKLAEILQQTDIAAVNPEMFTDGLENHLQQFSLQNAAIALNDLLF